MPCLPVDIYGSRMQEATPAWDLSTLYHAAAHATHTCYYYMISKRDSNAPHEPCLCDCTKTPRSRSSRHRCRRNIPRSFETSFRKLRTFLCLICHACGVCGDEMTACLLLKYHYLGIGRQEERSRVRSIRALSCPPRLSPPPV